LWGRPESLHKIYPPCDVTEFKMIKRKKYGRNTLVWEDVSTLIW
jgi:hypothetical protein